MFLMMHKILWKEYLPNTWSDIQNPLGDIYWGKATMSMRVKLRQESERQWQTLKIHAPNEIYQYHNVNGFEVSEWHATNDIQKTTIRIAIADSNLILKSFKMDLIIHEVGQKRYKCLLLYYKYCRKPAPVCHIVKLTKTVHHDSV